MRDYPWAVIIIAVWLMLVSCEFARSDFYENKEIYRDTVWCDTRMTGGCYEFEPPVLVEITDEGVAVGTEFRSETGCFLAARLGHHEKMQAKACFKTKKSAEKVFPALMMISTFATSEPTLSDHD